MKNTYEMFNNWRNFLLNENNLIEISQKAILQDFESTKGFVKLSLKSEESAILCINLLIKNIEVYLKYLKMSPDSEEFFILKNKDILNKKEKELTDENVQSLIKFTNECLAIILESYSNLTEKCEEVVEEIIEGKK